ncbi:DNA polymerase/3'-5' exonuclease PolX [Lujinxingia litoralis]|uniref:DNA-directed DNA polymerase n=1 Tax=Lujinxingia litoralis TaxID=2211119 RepID=A0A328C963_9DELT|nr:DNA polymerase/3'-5' exonuclease PolX [Lujinxingia litoralis]RAL25005.1 DNA polymerase/3'-5' exonuclease PolX [Lujinxingia litoralis]
MNNRDYARVLQEIAQLMEISGENRFKIRAFENATRTVETLPEELEAVMDRGDLKELKGIGASIAQDLLQIRQHGTCDIHRSLLERLDPGLLDMLRVQGLGPKRIKLVYHELGVSNLDALKEAAESGRLRELKGLGAKTEEKVLAEIERLARGGDRTPLPQARHVAESLRDQLAALPQTERIAIAGSIRRGRETIGDVDLLVSSMDPAPIHQTFCGLTEVKEVLVSGDTKTSVRLHNGIQVDLRTVKDEVFGSALHYFTGSKEHHIELRTRAKRQGLRVSEYGVFRDDEDTPIASHTEEELYQALGLPYIPPELREGRGEIESAARHELPVLLQPDQIRGDGHMHTTETDGRHSIEEMALAARDLGYEFIVITDHSQAVRVANGMTPERFREHMARIREADGRVEGIRILTGIEVDILKDGTLDMDHDLLAEADWVVGSIHSHFNQAPDQMTERLLRGMRTGLLSCLGHPTGRILGGRDGYRYDFDAIVEACVELGVALELNGSSGRLDLNAELAEKAHRQGAMLVLGSDAHSTAGLHDLSFAVQQARRAGLPAEAILNTLPVDAFLKATRPDL